MVDQVHMYIFPDRCSAMLHNSFDGANAHNMIHEFNAVTLQAQILRNVTRNTAFGHMGPRAFTGPYGPVFPECYLPSANPSAEMVPGFLVRVFGTCQGPPGPVYKAHSPRCCLPLANPSAEMVPRIMVHVTIKLGEDFVVFGFHFFTNP